MPRRELELLAPARDAAIGIEAVNHGADAIYIGGPGFGARDKASNSVADIERLARHAHRFGARVFVTVNTILRDDELEPARRLVHSLHAAGADALIVQDMALLDMAAAGELPPIQLHASTQTDIRTPEKARFLQDAGIRQMVLARELTLAQIRAIEAQVQDAVLEFFVHGALCVAYSGQCFISHAITGRSANRGSCSQECRQPYTVLDGENRIVAHEKHVLSLKDNNQSANLEALVDAGIRAFKIEGRYKDMATVKNVTAHYRQLFDALLERRSEFTASSDGRCRYTFQPDPDRGFHRGATDYFVNGRRPPEQGDIGAFDTPKHAGMPVGHVLRLGADHFDVETNDAATALNNGDALTWTDLQGDLQGVPINVAAPLGGRAWRLHPNAPMATLKGLRTGTEIARNRDMAWQRVLDKKSAERTIGVVMRLVEKRDGWRLELTDERGHRAAAEVAARHEPARDPARAEAAVREELARLGGTLFEARNDESVVQIHWREPRFIPPSTLNTLRRDAVAALGTARARALLPLPPGAPVEPPAPYPDDTLSYLANVYNRRAAAFYARHGVKVIAAAYESHEETGDVSLMITKHCVRWSLSLCPKQAKGVTGVHGTVRAEPLMLVQGNERFTLRFDCKPCEMHVVGRLKKSVLKQSAAAPLTFYRTRPAIHP
ncbi:MAG: U32 family peptidase [Burkholderiaceae bacterium]|nr:U32 family peptidase [Burkholderiaceae bacterium]